MKKVILTGAALIGFVAAGFAQNNISTVNQSVNSNQANVNQTWRPSGDPEPTVPPFNSLSNSKNISTVTQTGDANGGNLANVTQNGVSTATATQVGHNNTTNIDQLTNGGRSGISFELNATINQGVGGAASDNLANIKQRGVTNTATETQTGTSHEAYVDQQSFLSKGEATITQAGTNHFASITQNGSAVNPLGSYGPDMATITQSGLNQTAYVTQLTDGNAATVEQSGDNNQAYVKQGIAGELPGNSGDHKALVQQLGSSDFVDITQTGSANEVKTYQTAFDNRIVVVQSNGLNKAAMSQQDGDSNRANITQSGNNNVLEGLSDEYARQSGAGNQFTGNQLGGFGTIKLGQTGVGNVANVTQSGGGTIVVP